MLVFLFCVIETNTISDSKEQLGASKIAVRGHGFFSLVR